MEMVSSTRRLVDDHGLEAALQGGVLFDVLTVFVEGGSADAVQLAAGQHGLEQVAGVHGAFGLARAHHGVQFVDEKDHLAGGFLDFLEHRLEALFELAAVLGAGDQRAHVEGHDAFVLDPFGDVAADDAQRQSFDDGGFAHARLADEHGVVLGAPGEHLDDAADFLVAADDRVELVLRGQLGEVAAVALQGFVGGLGILRRDALVAPHLAQGLHEAFVREAEFLEQLARGSGCPEWPRGGRVPRKCNRP